MDAREPIPLARPALGEAELAAVERCMRSGRLVLGPENLRFEELLAAATGRAHGVCVTSGTTGLELALWALEVGPGDQVLVPAGGYPAAAHAALRLGATPVLVDIDPATWIIDVDAATAAITARTRAMIAVDTLGVVAPAAALEDLCRRHGVALIDDAACSLGGSDHDGRPGGGYGAIGVLSFHPRKVITTGEGGAALCDDPALAERLRRLRHQGQTGPGSFDRPGTNARLSEVAAAIGRVQMGRLEAFVRERTLLVEGYRERLDGLRAAGRLSWQEPAAGARPSHQSFAVMLADDAHLPDRDQVRTYLAQAEIESQVAIYALHGLDSLVGRLGETVGADPASPAAERWPVATAVAERGLVLPLYSGMRSAQLDRVCDTLTEVLA
ncbi:DegT/DnrJ/EryC1/StrS family aminotransferase [Haliangium sp.]|uniref:DegT/DnrJ/EryC1/StrS family aminotransferase n=1 Tax=Haliangium sp. TaxID=2663208 RepID=UPI003D0C91C6